MAGEFRKGMFAVMLKTGYSRFASIALKNFDS